MAMLCETFARECDGCMRCRDVPHVVCAACGGEIYQGEDARRAMGECFHDECIEHVVIGEDDECF